MPWAKLDDRFPRHPKVVGLSDPAFRLHVTGICYCAEHLTDGRITKMAVRLLGANRRQLDELKEAGLWIEHEKAWEVHDFLEYNPSKQKVEKEREEAAERKRKWKEKNAERNASRNEPRDTDGNGSPTRPDPARPEGTGAGDSDFKSAVAAAPQPSAVAATPDTKLGDEQVALNVAEVRAARAALRSA